MSGSHRAARPRMHRRPGVIAAGITFVALVVVVLGALALSERGHSPAEPDGPDPVTASGPDEPTRGATRKAHRESPRPIASLPAAPPKELSIAGLVEAGFDLASTPRDGVLHAVTRAELTRLDTRGLPGSPSTDTVVVAGEEREDGQGSLDRLAEVQRGDRILLRTQAGTLTYTVTSTTLRASATVLTWPPVRAHHDDRLVLVGVRVAGGARLGEDRVVVARLTGARPS